MGGACGAAAQREGCGGRPEGAVSPRAARRDGAPRTPEQPDPERSEGARPKNKSLQVSDWYYTHLRRKRSKVIRRSFWRA